MLTGSFVALITPFKNGEIDFDTLGKLIDFQLENGTDGILVAGTTGESPVFNDTEFIELVKFSKKQIQNRAKLIVGTGNNNTLTTIDRTKMAEDNGADYALVVTPYYNKPTQEGLFNHYQKIANSVSIPIIIYNVPGRTSVNILPKTVNKLQDIHNIVGIKAACGNLQQINDFLSNAKEDFSVLSGDDALTLPIMSLGAHGVISVVANIMPKQMSEMIHLCLDGNYTKALPLHRTIAEISKYMFMETNPIPVKTALYLMNKCENEFRLPMVPMSKENKKILENALKHFNLI